MNLMLRNKIFFLLFGFVDLLIGTHAYPQEIAPPSSGAKIDDSSPIQQLETLLGLDPYSEKHGRALGTAADIGPARTDKETDLGTLSDELTETNAQIGLESSGNDSLTQATASELAADGQSPSLSGTEVGKLQMGEAIPGDAVLLDLKDLAEITGKSVDVGPDETLRPHQCQGGVDAISSDRNCHNELPSAQVGELAEELTVDEVKGQDVDDELEVLEESEDFGELSAQAKESTATRQASFQYSLVEKDAPSLGNDFKIKLGFTRPSFSKIVHYDALYGGPSNYLGLQVAKYFWGDEFPLGLAFNLGYYKDEGNAASTATPEDGSIDSSEIDHDQKINLTLIPIQLNLTTHWHLFENFLVLDLWAGYENMIVQESRELSSESDKETKTKAYTNLGTNTGVAFGLGIGFRIDQLDGSTKSSLRSMDIGAIYLQPFLEVVTQSSTKMGDFSRSAIGLMVSFESK